ncbi:hypothetical protein SMCF_2822, partial [Streptomyces coelicoflavus ZG0656]
MTQPHAAHATPDTQGADGTPAGHAG